MPVPTKAQFQTNTRLVASGLQRGFLRNHRGSKISKIDDLLEVYDGVRGGANAAPKIAALSAVLAECGRFLKNKMGKTTGSIVVRRPQVLLLAREVFAELKALNGVGGRDFYNVRKAETTGRVLNHGLKPLHAGYMNERTTYVAGGKANHPIAAAAIHSAQANLPATGLGRTYRGNVAAMAVLNKSFETLTDTDYALIGAMDRDSSGMASPKVHFSNKAERSGQLLVVYPGDNHDFEKVDGTAFDTQADANGFMYAMDEYGSLFASQAVGLATGSSFWNHSSFNAGDVVVCAGMIRIHHGVLQYVDNDSGHYRPSRAGLHNLVSILDSEGINLHGANARVKEPAMMPGFVNLHTLNAAQFAGNVNMVDPGFVTQPA